jgi:hypothetical protein
MVANLVSLRSRHRAAPAVSLLEAGPETETGKSQRWGLSVQPHEHEVRAVGPWNRIHLIYGIFTDSQLL